MEKNKQTTSRASQTRSKTEKPKVWSPPNSLDAPPAPKGFRHQWIRAESMGYEDTKNVAASLREGYELVRADEYPDQDFPQMIEGKYAGVIGVGGLLLARIPEEIAAQIEAYYNQKTQEKEEAINNDLMKEKQAGMKFRNESASSVTFGGTKKS